MPSKYFIVKLFRIRRIVQSQQANFIKKALDESSAFFDVLGRHCDSGSTLFSQRAFYYEAVRFVSDIWKCTNFIFLLRLSVKQKKFVVLYPMAEDYRYDIFFSFLINLYRWHIASIHQPIFLIISSLLFILWIQDKTYKYILKAWVWWIFIFL